MSKKARLMDADEYYTCLIQSYKSILHIIFILSLYIYGSVFTICPNNVIANGGRPKHKQRQKCVCLNFSLSFNFFFHEKIMDFFLKGFCIIFINGFGVIIFQPAAGIMFGTPHDNSLLHTRQCQVTQNPYCAWNGWTTTKQSSSPGKWQLDTLSRGISSSDMH